MTRLATRMPARDAASPAPHRLRVRPAPRAWCSHAARATGGWLKRVISGPSPRSAPSPGARGFYDRQRANGKSHHQALRALGKRLVGVLHGCLANRKRYDELVAWSRAAQVAA